MSKKLVSSSESRSDRKMTLDAMFLLFIHVARFSHILTAKYNGDRRAYTFYNFYNNVGDTCHAHACKSERKHFKIYLKLTSSLPQLSHDDDDD